jgi:3-oxoacyl-[acyl-carrier-protein] synthase-3
MDTTDEWIRSHTGISARHIADPGTAVSDLATTAATEAINLLSTNTGESPDDIVASLDLIVLATTTPDYLNVPATACVIQDRLGAKNAACFDISACCTGLIYGLEIAAGLFLFNPTRRRALVLSSEMLSHITDWTDRSTAVLFGDGAAAFIVENTPAPSTGPNRRGIVRSIIGADGSRVTALYVPDGGTRNPLKAGQVLDKLPHVVMDGRAVYNFAVKAITDTIKQLLDMDGLSINDIKYIIPHQANARIVNAAGKRIGIPTEKFYLNIAEYANTSAASIGIALDELNRAGRLERGDLLLLVGFGGGLTYGGCLIVW